MKLPAWINTATAALAAAVLPACDGFNLQDIRPGITTQAEVRARMGEPSRVHWNDDGTAVWEYNRQPNGVHCHMIAFNRDNIVASGAEVVATGCPACMMQLSDMLAHNGDSVTVKHTIEIYADSLK